MKIEKTFLQISETPTHKLISLRNQITSALHFRMDVCEASNYEEGDYDLWVDECVDDDMPEKLARGIWEIAHSEDYIRLRKIWDKE